MFKKLLERIYFWLVCQRIELDVWANPLALSKIIFMEFTMKPAFERGGMAEVRKEVDIYNKRIDWKKEILERNPENIHIVNLPWASDELGIVYGSMLPIGDFIVGEERDTRQMCIIAERIGYEGDPNIDPEIMELVDLYMSEMNGLLWRKVNDRNNLA